MKYRDILSTIINRYGKRWYTKLLSGPLSYNLTIFIYLCIFKKKIMNIGLNNKMCTTIRNLIRFFFTLLILNGVTTLLLFFIINK